MEYTATWQSLDEHRAPEWFHDAKFGLFVHYIPTRFPDDGYPEPTNYSGEEWVDAALDAGARYIVPTCKHGDGHLNWPSDHREFGFGSEAVGDERDVITPLVETARRRGLKVGLYYCWATRDHPYEDQRSFVLDTTYEERETINEEYGLVDTPEYVEYAHDQVRELADMYAPDLFWFDGDGRITARDDGVEFYRVRELVADLYNRAEAEERDICVNDRLGTEYRKQFWGPDHEQRTDEAHGDFWTPEGQLMEDVCTHKWEASHLLTDEWTWTPSRTIRSPGQLIELLVDVVSKNGNLLLNVGPKPDGTIDEDDRAVLSAIGDWLDVNGEAIYGTRPFEAGVDSPEPLWDWEAEVAASGPLRMTREGKVAYAIHAGWPGDVLRVPGVVPRDGASIELLGDDEPLDWKAVDDGIAIDTPDDQPCDHAFAFRIPLPFE